MARWIKRPEGSNWGDYGSDDELGQMNLLTPERRRAAMAEVRDGLSFSLSLPLDLPGGASLTPGRSPPRILANIRADGATSYNYAFSQQNPLLYDVVSDEAVVLSTQYSTQWDTLGHWGQEFDADGDGVAEIVYYNGYRGGTDIQGGAHQAAYAKHLSAESLGHFPAQGRGVLLDLEQHWGRDRTIVGYDVLMEVIAEADVEVGAGDFLCLYTGLADLILEMKGEPDFAVLQDACAVLDGRDQRLLEWISNSGIVAICADNFGVEAVGNPHVNCCDRPHSFMPLHEHCLFKRGILLGELWHLGELARHLRARARHAFLLTAPALRLPGCVGSPLNPIATI